jgi:hypothetical protein
MKNQGLPPWFFVCSLLWKRRALLLLLSPDHGQYLFTEGTFAPLAYIKPLFFPVTQVAHEEMQIANSTT